MNFFIKNIFVGLTFLVFLIGNVEAAVRVFAQVDKSKDIYVGENFGYHIIIDGDNKAGQVNLTPLSKYNPQSAGNRDVSQTSISIINGRRTQQITKRYVMSYSLVSNMAGQIKLPSVTVMIDGKSYRTNPVNVNIVRPGSTDLLDLEVELSEKECYVGQPVIMTVKFFISADIGNFQFNIPAFSSNDFYIEDPDTFNPQAKEYDLGNGVIVRVSQYRTVHKARESILLSFNKILIPRNAGEIVISPASVSADIAVGRTRSRDRFFGDDFFNGFFGSQKEYKRFMVSSQPLKLKVSPLPQEGKPSEFYGLVGQYSIAASATPTKVNVGDPITLTIKIGGGKYLKPVQWPALEKIPELANNFKIPSEKASPTVENGYKVFTQTIRANNDEISEIPAIPLVFFDADKGKYEIAETKPIKLDVSPTKILTQADLEGLDFAPVNKEVEAIKKGLSANYESLDALTNQTFSPLVAAVSVPYLLIWAGPLVLLAVSSLIKFFTYTTPEKVATKRRRMAANRAIVQLKKLDSYPPEQWHELCALTMKQYIGDRFDKLAGSLTSNDCFEIILSQTNDNQSAEEYKEIMATCEAARYASTEQVCESSKVKKAIDLIKTIEKKSKK